MEPEKASGPDTVIPGPELAAETDESHDTATRTVTGTPAGERVAVRFASKAAQRGYTVAQNIVLFDPRLAAEARLLYFQLAHYAWRNPSDFPTQPEIAENLGVGDRQLRRYLAALEARWLLERRERGLGRPVEYVLHEPTPDYLHRDPRPPRLSKRSSSTRSSPSVERRGSSDIDDRPGSDTSDRLARTPTSVPSLPESSEDLKIKPEVVPVRTAVTRDDWQHVADAVQLSLASASAPHQGGTP